MTHIHYFVERLRKVLAEINPDWVGAESHSGDAGQQKVLK
jgi:hypothetical protein